MLIKTYDLNDQLIVEIGKFAVLWNLFEKNHCNYKCNLSNILDVCNYVSVSNDKQTQLAKTLNDRRSWFEQLYTDFIVGGLYSASRSPNEDEIKYIETFLKQEENSIRGCLLCLYRIRNNLMHGLKNVEDLNTQLDIFKAANDILQSL